MSPEKAPPELPARSGTNTTEKVVVTFRFPRWFALPDTVVEQLEADCAAMGMDRRKYVTRVLMRRYDELLEKGPGFEKAAAGRRTK
jgi:hypothetical protein